MSVARLLVLAIATAAVASATATAQALGASIEPGVLPKAWAVSGPECGEGPAWQVHEYNPNFYMLRQSGCIHYTKDKPVAHILGTHIEQTRTPLVDYPRGTVYQPDGHVLELTRGTLLELDEAPTQLNGTLQRVVLRDVILSPRTPRNQASP